MLRRPLLGLSALMLAASACAPAPESIPVPGQLIGRWETSEESYADRFVEIRSGSIAFGTGEGSPSPHAIVGVQEQQDMRGRLYTIEYVEEGQTRNRFAVYFDEAGPYVRLANRPGFEWVRREAS